MITKFAGKRFFAPLGLCLALSGILQKEETSPPALRGLDPVELCHGREVRGSADFNAKHYNYTYHFSNLENLKIFKADPSQYCIQMGGGCARMGPLSGAGSPERYAVHQERIYIFASDMCRASFLKNPGMHLETPASRPAGSSEELAKGAEWVKLALAAHGGGEIIRNISETVNFTTKSGGVEYNVSRGRIVEFSERSGIQRGATNESWNESAFSTKLSAPAKGAQIDSRGARPMEPVQIDAFKAELMQHPLAWLAASKWEGFVAVSRGQGSVGEARLESVDVYFNGMGATLGIHPETHRVEWMKYRGRASAAPPADMEITFSEFKNSGKFVVPFHQKVLLNGKPSEDLSHARTRVNVNTPVEDSIFNWK